MRSSQGGDGPGILAAKCPSCLKSVYAAEQALGPGATPYHKSCLRCTHCHKVLDPFSILEHGYDPYCKICHSKAFGTKGVGFGNAVVAEYAPRTPSNPASPTHLPPPSPIIPSASNSTREEAEEEERTRAWSPQQRVQPHTPSQPAPPELSPACSGADEQDFEPPSLSSLQIIVTPRPKPSASPSATSLSNAPAGPPSPHQASLKYPLTPPPKPPKPVLPYPPARAASSSPYNPRPAPAFTRPAFGIDGPQRCPACSQTVYHAEQVLAIGKKWHKRCLRCAVCSKALDSNFSERAGKPYCTKCYDVHFGTGAHGFVLRAGFAAK
ncbi:hypothetical protein PtA15_11A646 [Puccinia triticina]|uniref:LIM zinc-binding domain-containing protein n=1 Tax=Puccinia triticina TaxID=208348 RepID=A0ABY7CXC3_9BASI|nr:uncharacterized protein PtA15_11A646 [Puccinia triticina]WAQ89954.1 hypothetical protein PtA15_11A646 [Puccinia triticina]WAR59994.1 hypothetical protein PtB15_11B635 [Puccinia triticina]